jgi:hypothetical protein
VVHGDVTFGPGVVVRGAVEIDAQEPTRIEETELSGSLAIGPTSDWLH